MRQQVRFLGPLAWISAALSLVGCTSPPYQPARVPHSQKDVPPEVQYWRGTFEGGGGIKIFEQGWRPEGTSRAAIILVHGLKDHSSRYRELGITLAHRGLSLYGFDLRGHGYSEGVRDHIDSLDNAIKDLDGVLSRVRDREKGKPVYLLGHGFGASLAGIYVGREQRPVDGVVLIAPPLRGEVKRSERMGTRAAAIFGPTTGGLEIDLTKWSSDASVVAALKSDPLIYDGEPTASTAGEMLRASDELSKLAPTIKTPVLVLFGGADSVSSAELGKALFEKLGAADKGFETYEGLFYDVLHEPRRDEVVGDLVEWVSDHAAKAIAARPATAAPAPAPGAAAAAKK